MRFSHIPSDKSVIQALILTFMSLVFRLLFKKWLRTRQIHHLKHQHNCQPPTSYPHTSLWGSDLTQLRKSAMIDGKFFALYATQFATYGKTWQETWRGKPLINTIEPANLQQVGATALEDYGKDPERIRASSPLFGPSVFSDGEIWKTARALVKPIFKRAELSDVNRFASFVDRFMELLPDDGRMVNMQPLLDRLFCDVSMDFIFGKSMGALQTEVPAECTKFLEAYSLAQKWITKRRESGWLHFHLYRFYGPKEWRDAYTTVHKYVDQQVARALAEVAGEKPTAEAEAPSKKRYILLHEMAKQIHDPIALRYQVLGVFNPARDTVSILVGNTLFQLARHPNVWAELRKTSLGLDENTPLTFEKLKSLVDFRNVVHETIRICGPAARIWRVAVRDTILPVGGGADQRSPVFVPSGTPVVLGTWSMGRAKDVWGDDVENFRPDRWIGRKPLWEFVPFFGGARICPAQQQVLTQAIYLLVRLTQRYERMDNCDPVFEYIEQFTLGFQSRNGVQVAFKNS